MTTINDVTSTLNAMHLADTNERIGDMEIDHLSPGKQKRVRLEAELDDEMELILSDGERKTYEIYVECCSDNADDTIETYVSIMNDVVGSRENAIALLAGNMHDMNCFFVDLTRAELDKLVEIDNEKIRGIYPPYKPID